MVIEQQVEGLTEEVQPVEVGTEEAPAETADATEGAPESEAPESTKPAWDDLKAQIEADEDHKAAYESEKSAEYFKGRDEARQELPEFQQAIAAHKAAERQFQTAAQHLPALIEAIRDGDPDTINETLGKHPQMAPALKAYADALNGAGVSQYLQSQAELLEPLGIDASQPQNLAGQFLAARFSFDRATIEGIAKKVGNASILKDFDQAIAARKPIREAMDAALDAFANAHFQRGKKERGFADGEKAKADARSGQGPDLAEKSPGATQNYDAAWAATAPIEELKRIREKQKSG